MNLHHASSKKKKYLIISAVFLGAVMILAVAVGGLLQSRTATIPTNAPTKPVAVAEAKQVPVPNYCEGNAEGKLLLVSISKQHMWACDGTKLEKESAVTTGITINPNGVDDNTPTGTWKIHSKQTNLHLRGSDANGSWDDPVQYWMPFDGAVGFHDSSWQTFPYGSEEYRTNGSHGCVHLPIEMMAWVYEWAPAGTTVTVQA